MSSSSGSMWNRDDWQGLEYEKLITLYVKFNALHSLVTIFVCGLLAASLFLYSTSTYMNHELDTSGRELAASISQVISNDILVDDRFAMTEQLLHAQQTNDQVRYIHGDLSRWPYPASTFTDGLPKACRNGATCARRSR